jgi:phosphohistidine phosphatase
MMIVDPGRKLVLLRHAKSAWPHGVPDHERPLAGKGRRNAQAVGAWFTDEGPVPDLALCSDAVRARHTWEIVCGVLAEPVPTMIVPALYGAHPQDLLDLLHRVDPAVHVLVVIGHEPTMSETTLLLAGPGSDPTALTRVAAKYPTNGVASLRIPGAWADLAAGGAVLETFSVPRA